MTQKLIFFDLSKEPRNARKRKTSHSKVKYMLCRFDEIKERFVSIIIQLIQMDDET